MNKAKTHAHICERLTNLYIHKNHDYGDSFARNFDKFGLVYPIIHLQEKLDRLATLHSKEAMVTAESIDDTLMDLANYAILTLVERRTDAEKAVEPVVRRECASCASCKHYKEVPLSRECKDCHGGSHWEAEV